MMRSSPSDSVWMFCNVVMMRRTLLPGKIVAKSRCRVPQVMGRTTDTEPVSAATTDR